ncbi:hypothetical protein [Methylobacterium sp. PvR107]|uniref:hypothetical protein n=1 Tax=Methylobacterium sp. PvR107 TaxID=2806597 RepID=UPI0028A7BB82|nr:hypothetical protein [Methylobacterium sp. PvR107]
MTTLGRSSRVGVVQILAWGSSYYLSAVLAEPIARETGWPLAWIVGGLSVGLLVAAAVSPRVGTAIQGRGGRPVLALAALLLASGLTILGLAPTLPVFLTGWFVIGFGMDCGLYDPAYATLVLNRGGNGFYSIARGTGPLALFGPEHYAGLIGRLARPGLVAQALSPPLGAYLLTRIGPDAVWGVLALLARADRGLIGGLWHQTTRADRVAPGGAKDQNEPEPHPEREPHAHRDAAADPPRGISAE